MPAMRPAPRRFFATRSPATLARSALRRCSASRVCTPRAARRTRPCPSSSASHRARQSPARPSAWQQSYERAPTAQGNEAELRARLGADPANLNARLQLARTLAARGAYAETLPELMDVIRRDPRYADDAARKLMIDIFGCSAGVTDQRYRSELARALFANSGLQPRGRKCPAGAFYRAGTHTSFRLSMSVVRSVITARLFTNACQCASPWPAGQRIYELGGRWPRERRREGDALLVRLPPRRCRDPRPCRAGRRGVLLHGFAAVRPGLPYLPPDDVDPGCRPSGPGFQGAGPRCDAHPYLERARSIRLAVRITYWVAVGSRCVPLSRLPAVELGLVLRVVDDPLGDAVRRRAATTGIRPAACSPKITLLKKQVWKVHEWSSVLHSSRPMTGPAVGVVAVGFDRTRTPAREIVVLPALAVRVLTRNRSGNFLYPFGGVRLPSLTICEPPQGWKQVCPTAQSCFLSLTRARGAGHASAVVDRAECGPPASAQPRAARRLVARTPFFSGRSVKWERLRDEVRARGMGRHADAGVAAPRPGRTVSTIRVPGMAVASDGSPAGERETQLTSRAATVMPPESNGSHRHGVVLSFSAGHGSQTSPPSPHPHHRCSCSRVQLIRVGRGRAVVAALGAIAVPVRTGHRDDCIAEQLRLPLSLLQAFSHQFPQIAAVAATTPHVQHRRTRYGGTRHRHRQGGRRAGGLKRSVRQPLPTPFTFSDAREHPWRTALPRYHFASADRYRSSPYVSVMSQTPAVARHTVPAGPKASVRHAALVPLQLSATSQALSAGRQTVDAGARASAGQASPTPLQLSTTSQAPAAGRHTPGCSWRRQGGRTRAGAGLGSRIRRQPDGRRRTRTRAIRGTGVPDAVAALGNVTRPAAAHEHTAVLFPSAGQTPTRSGAGLGDVAGTGGRTACIADGLTISGLSFVRYSSRPRRTIPRPGRQAGELLFVSGGQPAPRSGEPPRCHTRRLRHGLACRRLEGVGRTRGARACRSRRHRTCRRGTADGRGGGEGAGQTLDTPSQLSSVARCWRDGIRRCSSRRRTRCRRPIARLGNVAHASRWPAGSRRSPPDGCSRRRRHTSAVQALPSSVHGVRSASKPSIGQVALEPVQASATSRRPWGDNWCWQLEGVRRARRVRRYQTSPMSHAPPRDGTYSRVPGRDAGTSRSPVARVGAAWIAVVGTGRPARGRAVGQARDHPEHVSAASHSPAAARHISLAGGTDTTTCSRRRWQIRGTFVRLRSPGGSRHRSRRGPVGACSRTCQSQLSVVHRAVTSHSPGAPCKRPCSVRRESLAARTRRETAVRLATPRRLETGAIPDERDSPLLRCRSRCRRCHWD